MSEAQPSEQLAAEGVPTEEPDLSAATLDPGPDEDTGVPAGFHHHAEGERLGPAPLAFKVVGGGEPSPEQVAAMIVALTPTAAADDGDEGGARGRGLTGWQEAALLEGVGIRPFYSLADVAAYHRNLA